MPIFRILATAAMAAIVSGSAILPPQAGLVAHEWGTFTSVADREGDPLPWFASSGPEPLPCFVHRSQVVSKLSALTTTVRMETPVIYFYTPSRTTLLVNVRFLRGRLTEWYPAAQESPGQLNWKSIDVLPGENPPLPRGEMENHYYAARRTDAAPLQAGSEREKLLFYRGVGDVEIPLRPKFTGGAVQIRLAGHGPVRGVVLFENRGGKVGYRIIGELNAAVQVDRTELTGDVARLRRDLAQSLIDAGLYPREAEAMLDTWRDSWFDEGMRVMYIVPPSIVNSELPLKITPRPAETARVFVGRIEILTPEVEEEIAAAAIRRDRAVYTKYGRFLQPFVSMIRSHNAAVDAAFPAEFTVNPAPCAK